MIFFKFLFGRTTIIESSRFGSLLSLLNQNKWEIKTGFSDIDYNDEVNLYRPQLSIQVLQGIYPKGYIKIYKF